MYNIIPGTLQQLFLVVKTLTPVHTKIVFYTHASVFCHTDYLICNNIVPQHPVLLIISNVIKEIVFLFLSSSFHQQNLVFPTRNCLYNAKSVVIYISGVGTLEISGEIYSTAGLRQKDSWRKDTNLITGKTQALGSLP